MPQPAPATSCIFHICSREVAVAARQSGEYRAPSLTAEGFIHLSQAHQVSRVAQAFYAGQTDLVLLVIDPRLLLSPLRYEPPAHPGGATPVSGMSPDQLFPHLYGPVNAGAIVDVVDLADFDGTLKLVRHSCRTTPKMPARE